MDEQEKDLNRPLFILDIGTRSVVGIAGHKQGDLFVVDAWDMEPHPRRAMVDGQIEDIAQVARVAGNVKARIEGKLGTVFTKVGVAAAGRALKTYRASASVNLPAKLAINAQFTYALENAAINEARLGLNVHREEAPYYCVGHSVVRYLLDGYPFSTIIGHRASRAEVEIIATFLPAEVVESLRRCMEHLGLEIDTLTLEPIAAIRAVIPRDLRLLNLALVDIGAGTSDIALSADGAVAGYTMATVAGDEVSEAIIRQFLVDFPTAEKLKMALAAGGPYDYNDILGFAHQPTEAELLEAVEPAVETLASVISEKISECNAGGTPAALFLVGGGSKIPGLPAKLAAKLGLDENRVALAGTRFSGTVLNEDSGLDGPEFATPVGIALTAADNTEVEGASVAVNGRRVRLFTPATTSVMDALLIGGYTYSDLMGRNGRPLTFMLNGERRTVRGGPYSAAELSVNGRPASLATPVKDGDEIDIIPAASGEDATATIADYAEGAAPLSVTLNGAAVQGGLVAKINGSAAVPNAAIHEQDDVEVRILRTAAQLCAAAGLNAAAPGLAVNGAPADSDTPLQDGDVLLCGAGEPAAPAARAALPETPAAKTPPAPKEPEAPPARLHIAQAARPATPKPPARPEPPAPAVVRRNAGRPLRIQLNGVPVDLPPKADGEPHRLFDVLALTELDAKNPKGLVKVTVNGQEAPYMEQLAGGDVIEAGWA